MCWVSGGPRGPGWWHEGTLLRMFTTVLTMHTRDPAWGLLHGVQKPRWENHVCPSFASCQVLQEFVCSLYFYLKTKNERKKMIRLLQYWGPLVGAGWAANWECWELWCSRGEPKKGCGQGEKDWVTENSATQWVFCYHRTSKQASKQTVRNKRQIIWSNTYFLLIKKKTKFGAREDRREAPRGRSSLSGHRPQLPLFPEPQRQVCYLLWCVRVLPLPGPQCPWRPTLLVALSPFPRLFAFTLRVHRAPLPLQGSSVLLLKLFKKKKSFSPERGSGGGIQVCFIKKTETKNQTSSSFDPISSSNQHLLVLSLILPWFKSCFYRIY